MSKHRFRESMKSFFGNHVHPEREEQLKGTKKDVDDKVKKILYLIKNDELEENDGISTTRSIKGPVVELIEDLHEQYQNLHSEYDHLTGELRKKFNGKREKDDSDSDHSSNERSSKNGKLGSESQKITDGMKQEIEAENLEIDDLKRKLTTVTEDYVAALSKIKELEEHMSSLKFEGEKQEQEKSRLFVANGELKHKVHVTSLMEAEMSQRLEDANMEKDNLILEKETAAKKAEEGEKIIEDRRRVVDQLKGENLSLGQEVEATRGELYNIQQQLESADKQIAELHQKLTSNEEVNRSLTNRLSDSLKQIQQEQDMNQQLMTEMSQLKEKLVEKEREFSTLLETHEVNRNQSLIQIQELEAKVTSLELELNSPGAKNRDLELLIESKISFEDQLKLENKGLQAQISELEQISEKRENELSVLNKQLEDSENEALSRIESLKNQVDNLLAVMESLRAEKAHMEEQMVSKDDEASNHSMHLMEQVNSLQQELEALHIQKAELLLQLERRSEEVSVYMMQIDNAKEDIARKTEDRQRITQERESFAARTKNLEEELESLHKQKDELEEQIGNNIEENGQLREEQARFQEKFFESEKLLAEKGLELSALQERCINVENEASSKMTALMEQIQKLQEELDSLQAQVNKLGLQLEREKQESLERLDEVESQKSTLLSQIIDQQRLLKEQEEAYDKLTADGKQMEVLFQECKANLEVAERKIEEMSEKFRRNIESKDQMIVELKAMVDDHKRNLEATGDERRELMSRIADHQRILKEQEDSYNKLMKEHKEVVISFEECKVNLGVAEGRIREMTEEINQIVESKDQIIADMDQAIEDLRREVEVKGDEKNTVAEKVSNIEVKLRLSNQKLRVTEQLLTEREESFSKAEAKFLEEQRLLEDKITALSGIIVTNNGAHCRLIKDISDKINSTVAGFEAAILKLEQEHGSYQKCISETSKELTNAKIWVCNIKGEKEKVEKDVIDLGMQLQTKTDQEFALKERLEQIHARANKEEGEKENLIESVKHLEKMIKEKDEGILGLGEEKREAIRQLCLWIDYHSGRSEYLKEMLSKTLRHSRQPRRT